MVVEVLPLTKLKRSLATFTYSVPSNHQGELQIGQIVAINFHGRDTRAIITQIKKTKPKYKLKSFKQLVFPHPLVTPEQIDLIFQTAERYPVSPATVARVLAPEIPKRQKKYLEKFESKNTVSKKQSKKYAKCCVSTIWYTRYEEKIKSYQQIIDRAKGQLLFLVPEIDMLDQLIASLDLADRDFVRLDSQTATGKVFDTWCDLITGQDKIIFGTKTSIFLPFTGLSQIIIDESQNWNHKNSDQNPRYDARHLASIVASQTGARLIKTTPAPTIEDYSRDQLKNKLPTFGPRPNIKILNLQDEQTKGNYTFLSDEFWHLARGHILSGKQAVVIHNRRGLAGFIHCPDCGHIFKCPECDIPLVYYEKTKRIHCHHCDYVRDIPPLCPKCAGSELKFNVKGTEDITRKIKQEFPGYKITEVSANSKTTDSTITSSQIIVGTQLALSRVDWSQIGLLFFTNLDQFLVSPDFRSPEKVLQTLFASSAKLATTSNLLIQTRDPHSLFLDSFVSARPQRFYNQELKNRQAFAYPPFSNLIKIFYRDKSQQKAYYLTDRLTKDFRAHSIKADIRGPLPAYPRQTRGQFYYNIILKVAPQDLLTTLDQISSLTPADFIIDTDPERII